MKIVKWTAFVVFLISLLWGLGIASTTAENRYFDKTNRTKISTAKDDFFIVDPSSEKIIIGRGDGKVGKDDATSKLPEVGKSNPGSDWVYLGYYQDPSCANNMASYNWKNKKTGEIKLGISPNPPDKFLKVEVSELSGYHTTTPIYPIEVRNIEPECILAITSNGDIILRGKTIGHDDELGKMISKGGKKI